MSEIPLETAPFVPITLSTKLLAWSTAAAYPGYTLLSSIRDLFRTEEPGNVIEWMGNNTYPFLIAHPSFYFGSLRPAVILSDTGAQFWSLVPKSSGYDCCWRLVSDGTPVINTLSINIPTIQGNLEISNSGSPLPNLGYGGVTFRLIIL